MCELNVRGLRIYVGSDEDLDEWGPDPEETVAYGQPPLNIVEMEDEKTTIPP